MKERIGVLYGGTSHEREVSLATGRAVLEALQEKGLDVVGIDVDSSVPRRILQERIEVAFMALHGGWGENGAIQGLLEIYGIPYTGPGILASALALDKTMTKKVLRAEGVPTPDWLSVSSAEVSAENLDETAGRIVSTLGLPVILKPSTEGSSVGIKVVRQAEEIPDALAYAARFSGTILVERFMTGIETTVGVIGNDDPRALPVIEIRPKGGLYTYETKYVPGQTEYIIPARLPEKIYGRVQELALRAFKAVGCRGVSRIDVFVDENHGPFVLEINTNPGMTATSLLPKAARATGMEFGDLLVYLLELALETKTGHPGRHCESTHKTA